MSDKESFDKTYVAALKFLVHKPRTVEEVRQKMLFYWSRKAGNYSSPNEIVKTVEAVIQALLDQKYLNDEQYVDSYLSYQADNRKKSSRELKNFLFKKGLPRDLVEAGFSKIANLDKDVLFDIASKKYLILKNKNLPKNKLKQRLAVYLMGKGFSADDVFNAVDRVLGVK